MFRPFSFPIYVVAHDLPWSSSLSALSVPNPNIIPFIRVYLYESELLRLSEPRCRIRVQHSGDAYGLPSCSCQILGKASYPRFVPYKHFSGVKRRVPINSSCMNRPFNLTSLCLGGREWSLISTEKCLGKMVWEQNVHVFIFYFSKTN